MWDCTSDCLFQSNWLEISSLHWAIFAWIKFKKMWSPAKLTSRLADWNWSSLFRMVLLLLIATRVRETLPSVTNSLFVVPHQLITLGLSFKIHDDLIKSLGVRKLCGVTSYLYRGLYKRCKMSGFFVDWNQMENVPSVPVFQLFLGIALACCNGGWTWCVLRRQYEFSGGLVVHCLTWRTIGFWGYHLSNEHLFKNPKEYVMSSCSFTSSCQCNGTGGREWTADGTAKSSCWTSHPR